MARDSKAVRKYRRTKRENSLLWRRLQQLTTENYLLAGYIERLKTKPKQSGTVSIEEVRDDGEAMDEVVPTAEGAVSDLSEASAEAEEQRG